MDNLEMFLCENKAKRENVFFAVSEDFKDSDGNVIKWEIKAVSTREEAEIRNDCTIFSEKGQRLNMNKYIATLISRAVVYPNLFDAKLQDSYNCKTPEDLIVAMVDKPGDYNRLVNKVQEINGFTSFDDDVKLAKN
ncbi:MAG: hypothetical protein ACI4VF_03175 [Lachnospirales bacterium]